MKYPKLVPPRLCNSTVNVIFLGELDIEGAETVLREFSGKCNLQVKTRQRLTADKRFVTINAVALFDGDIAPGIPHPKGTLSVKELFALETEDGDFVETEKGIAIEHFAFGKEYRIYSIAKEFNPDGTVNFTRMELTE